MANRRKQAPKSKPPPIVTNSNENGDFEFPDVEQQMKYELELNWCVRKLHIGIANEKDAKKQADAVKYLNTLNNKSVSVIRKRQIMHNLFGDYRTKMKNEEKSQGKQKISFDENVKLDQLVNSKFLRKSIHKSKNKTPQNASDLSDNMNNLAISIEKDEEVKEEENNRSNLEMINYFKMPTGNSNFTFNFNVESNTE